MSHLQPLDRPLWVRVGLWGLHTRASAWLCFWLAIAAALGSGLYGFRDGRFFLGLALVFAAPWYWLSIRWVDRAGGWPPAG
jgi:hypothetical protein